MKPQKLTPFTGIDNVSSEPSGVPGAARDAVNVDIDRSGQLTLRDGYAPFSSGAATAPWGSQVLGQLLCARGGNLVGLTPSGTAVTYGAVGDTDLEFVEVNGEVLVGGARTLAVIRGGALQGLGVEKPPAPLATATSTGGFGAAKYGVLMTFVAANGEESAASLATFLDVPAGGGIDIVANPLPFEAKVTAMNYYRTTPNGDVFYRCATAQRGASGFNLDFATPLGKLCETMYMERMRPGTYLRYWRGRALTVRGNVIYFSEAMRYGLYDTRHGYIQLPKVVTFLEPTDGGIYVGQPDGVLFLDGAAPGELKVVALGAAVPIPGSSISVAGSEMAGDFIQGSIKYAVWLGARGYAIGTPDGNVVEPQAKRLAVTVGQRGRTILANRRLTTLVL